MKIELDVDEATYRTFQNMAQLMGVPVERLLSLILITSVKSMLGMIGSRGIEGLLKMADDLRQVEGVKEFEQKWEEAKEKGSSGRAE